jgi:hypothetical protein
MNNSKKGAFMHITWPPHLLIVKIQIFMPSNDQPELALKVLLMQDFVQSSAAHQ